MSYIIKLEEFEGPFDLLLELIKKREMDIYNLQISQITQDFMNSLQEMQEKKIDITSDFMEMASQLLSIKAKLLIPVEVEKDDPRNELVKQLLEYQEYKETVEELKILRNFEEKYYKRQKQQVVKKEKNGTVQDIINSYKNIFAKKFSKQKNKAFDALTEELMRSKFTIEDRMDHLRSCLNQQEGIDVETYFDHLEDKEEMVVTFGAILELIKLQEMDIMIQSDKVFLVQKGDDSHE